MNDSGRNDKLGAAKPLYSVQHGGETYYLDFETQRVKAAFEAWAISRAFAGLAKRRGQVSDADYAIDRDQLNARIEAGDYALDGGQIVKGDDGKGRVLPNTLRKIMTTQEGMIALVRILLEKKHPKADSALVIALMSDPETAAQLQLVLDRIQADSAPKSDGSEPAEVASF